MLPRKGKAVFATLSAKVGSIGDNRMGGWYGYRAAKAALNQLVKTASIELARNKPDAICVSCIREPSIPAFPGRLPNRALMCKTPNRPQPGCLL